MSWLLLLKVLKSDNESPTLFFFRIILAILLVVLLLFDKYFLEVIGFLQKCQGDFHLDCIEYIHQLGIDISILSLPINEHKISSFI